MVKITPLPQRQRKVVTTTQTQMVPVSESMSVISAKTLRNRRRRARRRAAAPYKVNPLALSMNNAPYSSIMTQGAKSQFTAAPSTSLGIQGFNGTQTMQKMMNGKKISPDGIKFLKCAFAPPDFAGSDIKGVPDNYTGSSLIKKHRLVEPLNNNAGRDTYLFLLPTPGVAFWRLDLAAGAPLTNGLQLTPVFYSDVLSMFPNSANSTVNLNQFRYISNHIELVPTVNATQWAGSIQAWKLPVSVLSRTGLNAVNSGLLTVTGLQGAAANNVNMYSGPVCNGVYTGCYSADSTFRFTPIFDDVTPVPNILTNPDFMQLNVATPPGNPPAGTLLGCQGFDNAFESMVIRITNTSGTLINQFLIKAYACVEYKASPGSALKEYESVSPCEDEEALKLYREIVNELPVGVHYLDNDTFWQRVLDIIAKLGYAGSFLPGPYGMISAGVGGVATGIRNLAL